MRSLRESQFFGLLGHRLAMRIQLCLEPPNLVLSSDQRCELLLDASNQIAQRLPIECIQIRQRSVIHGRSMPLLRSGKLVENPHQYRGIMLIIRPRLPASTCARGSAPVDAFQKHRQLRTTEAHGSLCGLRPDEAATLETLGK